MDKQISQIAAPGWLQRVFDFASYCLNLSRNLCNLRIASRRDAYSSIECRTLQKALPEFQEAPLPSPEYYCVLSWEQNRINHMDHAI